MAGRAASVSAGLAVRPGAGGRPTDYAALVLAVVDRIPRGKVMSYGDVAEFVGNGTGRTVGAVMSRHGHEVPWQRVVRSTGEPNPASPEEALRLLRAEGVPMRGDRVDMARARWDGRGDSTVGGRGTARWEGGGRHGGRAGDGTVGGRGTAQWEGKEPDG